MFIRSYISSDYEQVAALYKRSDLFGGVFDENRDSTERLRKRIEADPDAILVAEENNKVVGTVSLIEDGRVAWLYRFCVLPGVHEGEITEELCTTALKTLGERGHKQVLVYTAPDNEMLHARYRRLGFERGGDYTCFWKDL